MLPQIKTNLFATDLSANADNALRQAVTLGQSPNAEVHIVHATEPLSTDAIVTLQMFLQDKSARDKAINDRRAAIKDLLKANQQALVATLSGEGRKALPRSSRSNWSRATRPKTSCALRPS